MVELVPKILFFYDTVGVCDWIIINGPVKSFVLDVFKTLKLDQKLIIMNNNNAYNVEELIVAGPLSEMSKPTQLQVNLLRKFFLKEPIRYSPNSKIYVSRTGSKRRRVINEFQIEKYFYSLGFRIIRTETLSFTEQINLFRNASVVVGLHGAGLTNTIFMNKKTEVIELVKDANSTNNIFYDLAKLNDSDYSCVILKSKFNSITGNTVVDIDNLIESFQQYDFVKTN